jgi:hypothetical protein
MLYSLGLNFFSILFFLHVSYSRYNSFKIFIKTTLKV